MINETINNTIQESSKLSFDKVTAVTTDPTFIILWIILVFLPAIIYIIIACFTKARSTSGQSLSSPMIYSPNTWIAPAVWIFFQSAFLLTFIIFPLWLKIFN